MRRREETVPFLFFLDGIIQGLLSIPQEQLLVQPCYLLSSDMAVVVSVAQHHTLISWGITNTISQHPD